MIRYALVCESRHEFEVWFNNSADYDKQKKRGLVTCPACSSKKVAKAIMAPAISRGSRSQARSSRSATEVTNESVSVPAPSEPSAPVAMISPQEREFRQKLKELRDHLTKNADNVGSKFPEEARKMHYGEVEHRSIYGEASPQEAKDLHDEGVEFHPLPVLPDERN